MIKIIKLYDLLLEISKTEILEYLNNLNLKEYPVMKKRIETKFETFIHNSTFIGDKDLVISSINENPETQYYIELNNIDISDESYFIYNYCGHSDDWMIYEFKDLKEVEKYLLEEYDNMFVTYLFVFKNLKRLKYKIKDNKVIWESN